MTDSGPALRGGEPAFPEGLPFFRPARPPLEQVLQRLGDSYDRGILTNGPLVRELEEATAEYLAVPHVVAVASCTAGLMLATQALTVPGSIAMMPSFTFSATAHAAVWAGAVPRFTECELGTCQLDVADMQRRFVDGSSLLIGTHVFGAPCRPEALEELARQKRVAVLFDAAHAFGAKRKGQRVGGFGTAEVFSLSPTKVLVAGEGGLVATRDADLAARLRIGRDYGNPGDYDTRFAGMNARMSEFHAAVALCSLDELDAHLAVRRALADRYREGLAELPGIRLQSVDADDVSTYKDLTVLVDEEDFGLDRDALVCALEAESVDTRCYFWPPVHRQQAYADLTTQELPVTDEVSRQVVSLPLWRDMPSDAVSRVVDAIASIQAHAEEIGEMINNEPSKGRVVASGENVACVPS